MEVEIIILIGVLYLLLLLAAVLKERKILKKIGMKKIGMFLLWLCLILGVLGGGYYMVHHIRSRIVPISKAKTGNTVLFGSYEQDGDEGNGAEAIEWIVLDKEDGKLLLLSKYVLDARGYAGAWYNVTWEDSNLRFWLNESFYKNAFTETEQDQILQTQVLNENNPEYGTKGGNDTIDHIFLLSLDEVDRYLSNYLVRMAKGTAYALDSNLWTWIGAAYWWLRSPGYSSISAALVLLNGAVYGNGLSVNYTDIGVRPALWVSIDEE